MGRYFFALWPEAGAAKELARVGEALAGLVGGKPMPVEKIHLTLAFLGSLDEEMAGSAVSIAGKVRARAIEMAMDTVGSFRRAKVGWVGPSQPHAELAALQSALEADLRDSGFRLEERAFNPHVTLVRKIENRCPARRRRRSGGGRAHSRSSSRRAMDATRSGRAGNSEGDRVPAFAGMTAGMTRLRGATRPCCLPRARDRSGRASYSGSSL